MAIQHAPVLRVDEDLVCGVCIHFHIEPVGEPGRVCRHGEDKQLGRDGVVAVAARVAESDPAIWIGDSRQLGGRFIADGN